MPSSTDKLPRLLIIGAAGFVGSRLAIAAAGRFQVIRGQRRVELGADRLPGEVVEVDVAQAETVDRAFVQARPDAVIHVAAMADIDRCQREPDLAEAINYQGACEVARRSAKAGARLLFTSTDAVFDGRSPPYREHSPTSPLNYYAETKVRAEAVVAELVPSAAIVRLSLVLGRAVLPDTNSYVDRLAENLAAGRSVATPTYERRNPIDVGTLCQWLLELAVRRDASGIFHAGASDSIGRYELAQELARALGHDPALIVPQHQRLPDRALRGCDSFLAGSRMAEACGARLPSCREVIERSVSAAE